MERFYNQSIYIIIDNLDAKMCWSKYCLDTLPLDSILISHKRAKDLNNKDKNLKTRIYYFVLKPIFKRM